MIAAVQVACCSSVIDSYKVEIDGKVVENKGKQTVDSSLFGISHSKWLGSNV